MEEFNKLLIKAKCERYDDMAKVYPLSFNCHDKSVTVVCFNKDNTLFFSAGKDGFINIFNAIKYIRLLEVKLEQAILNMFVSNDSQYLVCFSYIENIYIVNIASGTVQEKISLSDYKIISSSADYGNKTLTLLLNKIGEREHEVRIYDFKKLLDLGIKREQNAIKKSLISSFVIKEFEYTSMICDFSGEFIYFSLRNEGTVEKYSRGGELITRNNFNSKEIKKLKFTRRYEFLVMCCNNGVRMLNPDDLSELQYIQTNTPVLSFDISPLCYKKDNSKRYHLVYAGGVEAMDIANRAQGGLEIHVYNFIKKKHLLSLAGHFGPVNCIEFFKDGNGFITAGEEGFVRIYRIDKKYLTEKDLE